MGGAAVAAIGIAGQTANRLKDALGKAVQRQESNISSTSPASSLDDPIERLKKLKQMFEGGLITQGEFDTKKAEILSNI
jgi:membrane protease subunit (stomatin/prohibitin family)